jgi:hypothetical protein
MGAVTTDALVYNAVTQAKINGLGAINFDGLNFDGLIAAPDQTGMAVTPLGNGKYVLAFDSDQTGIITCNIGGYQLNPQKYVLGEALMTFAMQPIQGFNVQFQLTSGGPFVAPANISVFVDVQGNIALPLRTGTITWGDGASSNLDVSAVANGGTSVNHTYGSAGSYTMTCVITDSKNSQGSATLQVTVKSGAPFLYPVVKVSASVLNFVATANIVVENPPPQATDALSINWGDGSGDEPLGSNDITVTHAYQEPGTYNVSAKLAINNGPTFGSNVVKIVVTAPPFPDYIVPLLL